MRNSFFGAALSMVSIALLAIFTDRWGQAVALTFMILGVISTFVWLITEARIIIPRKPWGEIARGYCLLWAIPGLIYFFLWFRF